MKFFIMILILIISLFLTKYGVSEFFAWQVEGSYTLAGNIFDSLDLEAKKGSSFTLAMANTPESKDSTETKIKLPAPTHKGSMSVEETIKKRRTQRSFLPIALSQQQLSQILWAAQGITEERGFKRSIPSAGALYPLDIFVVVGKEGVNGLKSGLYHYQPDHQQLTCVIRGDIRKKVAEAALSQMWISPAPITIIITAEYDRTTRKYGKRGIRYVHMEVGHAAQNIFLQAEALNLGAGIVGAFEDNSLKEILELPDNYDPLLIMPVGISNS